ncbi:MAG: energy transducer TonB [Bacteroidota bacterium]|nr:energy transducer TonB [Bacteroidota bacterium]MDP4233289.1 energy transducer TonB [Bacteroidota bacterium]MDP4242091.1 energy transducer TonB [Bacteroidota bacterium]MDP4288630.1 energy transducer TonB [Bacteroidota bacterium]
MGHSTCALLLIAGILHAFGLFSDSAYGQRADTATGILKADTAVFEPSSKRFDGEEPVAITPIERLIVYPDVAKRSGLEGRVVVQALIAKDGHVEKVQVLRSDYDVFRHPAVDALMKAKFAPAKYHGEPVRIWITRTITFKLR